MPMRGIAIRPLRRARPGRGQLERPTFVAETSPDGNAAGPSRRLRRRADNRHSMPAGLPAPPLQTIPPFRTPHPPSAPVSFRRMARLKDVPTVVRSVGALGFGKRVWQQIIEDNLFAWASALAYSWLFAVFPFLIFV